MEALSALTTPDVFKVVASSTVLATCFSVALTRAFTVWDARRGQKARRRYSAMRIAVLFEGHCLATQQREVAIPTGERSIFITDTACIPALGTFPADVDWSALDTDLAAIALGYSQEIDHWNYQIRGLKVEPGSAFLARELCERVRKRSAALAAKIRQIHGLPPKDWSLQTSGWATRLPVEVIRENRARSSA